MIKLILNTIKLLIKKKSYIIMSIILPAFVIIFFTFEFGGEYKFNVGIIDNDNSYISKEIIKTIDNLEGIQSIKIEEKDSNILLITQQIQLAVIIEDNFQNKILTSKNNQIITKSINQNDVESIVLKVLDLKCEDLAMISSMSNNDINKFKKLNEEYNDQISKLSLNDVEEIKPKIEKSLGLIIFIMFIAGGNIANFLIEDEENKTKIRILSSGVSKYKYYVSLILVFYTMSFITTFLYYFICKLLKIDFGMKNTINFLIVMTIFNLVILSFNFCIASIARSKYIANIINIIIMVPCCMMSGVFWDFSIMSKNLQSVGKFMPTRWVYVSIKNIQNTNDLESSKIYLYLMIFLSIILFFISFIKLKINEEI